MSIKKDEVLEKERAAKEKKSLAAILDKIKNKKAIRVFTNSDIRDNFDKNQAVKKQYGKLSNTEKVFKNMNDTTDLIIHDPVLYRKLMLVAKVLESKGLVKELSVKGGFLFSTNDKVNEVLQRVAEIIDNPNLSDKDLESQTKSFIFESDLDNRTSLNTDIDNNGLDDYLEDRDNNGVKDINEKKEKLILDPWKHRAAYDRDIAADNMKQQQDAAYREECRRRQEKNEKEREQEEKQHGRGLTSLLGSDE